MRQSRISEKNVQRLETLRASDDERVAELADVVLEVAQVKPRKKGRHRMLARDRRDLLQRLDETGLSHADEW